MEFLILVTQNTKKCFRRKKKHKKLSTGSLFLESTIPKMKQKRLPENLGRQDFTIASITIDQGFYSIN